MGRSDRIIKAISGYDIRTIDEKEVSSAKSAEAIENESGRKGEGASTDILNTADTPYRSALESTSNHIS